MRKLLSVKLFGLPLLGTFIGSFVLLATMFMWLGSFFVDNFHHQLGIIEADVDAEALGYWYPLGFVFCALQGVGLALILKWRNWPNFVESAITGAFVAFLLGAMVFAYPLTIQPDHNVILFLIYAFGLIVSWTLGALTMGLLRPAPLDPGLIEVV